MGLKDLLEGVRVVKLYSGMFGKMVLTQDVSVRNIVYDSRKVVPGDMFVAIRGNAVDGHRFLQAAMRAGAVVAVVDDDASLPDTAFMHAGVLKIVVPDSRAALAQMAANLYGRPADRLTLIGVTGTNGKTTTTHLIRSILEAHGVRTGLVGTIEYRTGGATLPASHTTPESLELQGLLAEMVREGCSAGVMEVSSHALTMHRVDGMKFRAGVFTNLTQDHLDYHGSMEEYFRAKQQLFTALGNDAVGIVNADDAAGLHMMERSAATTLTYGVSPSADVRASEITLAISGSRCRIHYRGASMQVASPLTGRFNVSNILAAAATGFALGFDAATIGKGIADVRTVRGRFEQVAGPKGWTAIIDYAHTPDALENCLRTIREVMPRGAGHRVVTVFGCGGNRDRGKRPIMGRIAATLSDEVIVTSDNPRREEPMAIIDEILAGTSGTAHVRTEADRRTAIRLALGTARTGDVILIAGKGHETYQVIGETRQHFDDREEVENFIREQG